MEIISEEEWNRRKEFVGLGAGDAKILAELAPMMKENVCDFVDSLYDYLKKFPEIQGFLADESAVARLKVTQSAYFCRLFSGKYDYDYLKDRLRIGQTHHRIGLDMKWYMGAFYIYIEFISPKVIEVYKNDTAKTVRALLAINKLINLDEEIAITSYIDSLEKELVDSNKGLVAITMELRKAQADLRSIFENSIEGIYTTDGEGKILMANPSFMKLMGYESENEFVASVKNAANIYKDRESYQKIVEHFKNHNSLLKHVSNIRHRHGAETIIAQNIRKVTDEDGVLTGYESIVEDITDKRHLEERMKLIAKVFEHSVEGIVITDANTQILEVNRAFCDITGYSMEEATNSATNLLYSGWQGEKFYSQMWRKLKREGIWQGEIKDRRKNGEMYMQWLTICAVKDARNKVLNYIGIFTDITEKKMSEKKIHQLAYYDVLTGLPNRSLLHDRLGHAIKVAHRNNTLLAVLFIDLDNFKNINDMLGHHIGDRFLQVVAERLTGCVREKDTVARLGGDEFVIVMEGIKDSESASNVAKSIITEMSTVFNIGSNDIYSGASIGVSIYPEDGTDAVSLLKNADTAMYNAKDLGKNDYRFYTEEMNLQAFERVSLETDLRKALEKNEFVLYYQPKIDLQSGDIVGAEALIRWNHTDMGLVAPGRFIPIAEKSALIEAIGEWVFYEAFGQVIRWQKEGLAPPRISVNVSAKQLGQQNFHKNIERIMQSTGIMPGMVEIEVTESCVMVDADNAVQMLGRLKDVGVSVSLDDFGTGYSSLSQLKKLPIDSVKIDQSFVRDIMTNEEGKSIIRAMISLSHNMNLEVIAEGVENEEECLFLAEEKCDEAQGFLFYHPLPADEFAKLI